MADKFGKNTSEGFANLHGADPSSGDKDRLVLLPIRAPDLRGRTTERPAALPSKMPPPDIVHVPRVTELPDRGSDVSIRALPPASAVDPMMEVAVRYSCAPDRTANRDDQWLEVWTRNTVYMLDHRMVCVQVLSADSGEPIAAHSFLGAKLVGGQLREPDGIEVSYPLPKPGAAAVFEIKRGLKRRFSRTSAVERVVAELNVVKVPADGQNVQWEDIVKR